MTLSQIVTALLTGIIADEALDIPGGVWDQQAPQGRPYPLVIFDLEDDTEANTIKHRAREVMLTVKVFSEVSYLEADTFMDALDSKLHEQPPTVEGLNIYSFQRERATPRLMSPRLGGGNYHQVGHLYRVSLEVVSIP